MRIGVFSKFDCAGGSEFRCVEMANGISAIPPHQGVLLSERGVPDRVRAAVKHGVDVHEGIFSKPCMEPLYSLDRLVVVNTDSKEFTTADYWLGRSARHAYRADLSRLKSMTFLFNFIVSPARYLPTLEPYVQDLRIITANIKFFREISEQDRYELVRHYPRIRLESPIDPDSIGTQKSVSDRLRFGMHSKPMRNKWNGELGQLIQSVNEKHLARVSWDFMGIPSSVAGALSGIPNVTVRKEFAVPVKDFLHGVDVFVYFLGWDREEPWSRCAAEALASGCPVITTANGGNVDQVVHGNNGYLCRNTQDFVKHCLLMIEHRERRLVLGRNAAARARRFFSTDVNRRLLAFLE